MGSEFLGGLKENVKKPQAVSLPWYEPGTSRIQATSVTALGKLVYLIGAILTFRSRKTENTAVGIRHADHVAPSIRKNWH
jgi:hypothetical protein